MKEDGVWVWRERPEEDEEEGEEEDDEDHDGEGEGEAEEQPTMSNREAKRTKKRAREMIAEGEQLLAKHREHEEAKKARKIMQEEEAQKEEASRLERERLEAEHEARRAAWNSGSSSRSWRPKTPQWICRSCWTENNDKKLRCRVCWAHWWKNSDWKK